MHAFPGEPVDRTEGRDIVGQRSLAKVSRAGPARMGPVDRPTGLSGRTARQRSVQAAEQVKAAVLEQTVNSESAGSVPIQRKRISSARISC
jgi:hypothetical protein